MVRLGFDLHMTAEARNVARARAAAAELAKRAGFPSERRSDVMLAVGEACANAVVHAYADGARGPVDVEGQLHGGDLEISVLDRGRGLAPRPDSPGAGFGLPLVAALASSVELRPVPGGGTEVRMRFARA